MSPSVEPDRRRRTIEAERAAGTGDIFHSTLPDASPGVQQLPGLGPTDFTPWLGALAKINYRWYVNPFLHGEPPPDETAKALAKSVKYLKECYAKI